MAIAVSNRYGTLAFKNFQTGPSTRMRSRQVFTERLDVTAPVETSRHPVSTRRLLLRSADRQPVEIMAERQKPDDSSLS